MRERFRENCIFKLVICKRRISDGMKSGGHRKEGECLCTDRGCAFAAPPPPCYEAQTAPVSSSCFLFRVFSTARSILDSISMRLLVSSPRFSSLFPLSLQVRSSPFHIESILLKASSCLLVVIAKERRGCYLERERQLFIHKSITVPGSIVEISASQSDLSLLYCERASEAPRGCTTIRHVTRFVTRVITHTTPELFLFHYPVQIKRERKTNTIGQ